MGRQWKLNLDTGNAFLVNSKATERNAEEQQASLEQWAKDLEALAKLQPEIEVEEEQNPCQPS